MASKPTAYEAVLIVHGFKWTPAKRRDDGGFKSRAQIALNLSHRDAPCADLMKFLAKAQGVLKVGIVAPETVVPALDRWEGFAELGTVNWKPPGDRADEQGQEHPTVTIPLIFGENDATDLLELMKLRVELDGAKAETATVRIQVWQEDLPFSVVPEPETAGAAAG